MIETLSLGDIYAARKRVASIIWRTPLVPSPSLTRHLGREVYLKLENLQVTGSFKLRGAVNKLATLSEEQRDRGVITVSTGNHGRAVAFASRRMGIRAVVCLSENTPANKIEAIAALGAEVVKQGNSYDEAAEHAAALEQELGLVYVEPFDDLDIIAGQGTVGLEILEDLPELGMAVVPLSGGGLMAGTALALKGANSRIRTIGVSMDRAPVMYHSLRAGRPIELPEEETLADALVGGIGLQNRHTFRMVEQLVDETKLVTEEEIAAAMVFAFEHHNLVIEGGGAVALGALLAGHVGGIESPVVVVVSGGNVSKDILLQVLGTAGKAG